MAARGDPCARLFGRAAHGVPPSRALMSVDAPPLPVPVHAPWVIRVSLAMLTAAAVVCGRGTSARADEAPRTPAASIASLGFDNVRADSVLGWIAYENRRYRHSAFARGVVVGHAGFESGDLLGDRAIAFAPTGGSQE